MRLELPEFTYPMDCLFIIYSKAVLKMPFRELRRLLRELLDRSLTELSPKH